LYHNGRPIIQLFYPKYRQECLTTKNPTYYIAWKKKQIYQNIDQHGVKFKNIPLNLFTFNVRPSSLVRQFIPDRNLIQTYFSPQILVIYDQNPEIWIYSALYLMG